MAKAQKKLKEFKLSLKYKGCEKNLLEGEDPGVVVVQNIVYELTDKDYKSSMFTVELLRQQEAFLEEHMEVVIEEVT